MRNFNWNTLEQTAYNPYNSLIFLCKRVGRLLAKRVHKKLEAEVPELHPQHIGLLVDLWTKDGVRQQDLAISQIKDKATITRSLQQLEQQNLLVRVADRQDKRNKRIYLTHRGKELQHTIWPMASGVITEATASISQEEMDICKKVLISLYEELK